MVLVSYILDNYVSILQTKFSHRQGHKARRVGLEAMPLNQHIEGCHSKGQARLKIRPAPMHHLFEMADQRQHREHCLHQHAVLPRTALTQFKVRGIALGGMEGVWLKNSAGSRCVAIVIAQEPTQALSTSHLTAAA